MTDLREYGDCPLGLTEDELKTLLGPTYGRFVRWMRGQTGAICDGRRYNHNSQKYEADDCGENPHGLVVYRWDVERFMAGLPVVD